MSRLQEVGGRMIDRRVARLSFIGIGSGGKDGAIGTQYGWSDLGSGWVAQQNHRACRTDPFSYSRYVFFGVLGVERVFRVYRQNRSVGEQGPALFIVQVFFVRPGKAPT